MGTGKGVLQGYTGAAAVDARHQIILEAQAHGTGSEQEVLLPVSRARRRVSNPRLRDQVKIARYREELATAEQRLREAEAAEREHRLRPRSERLDDRESEHRSTALVSAVDKPLYGCGRDVEITANDNQGRTILEIRVPGADAETQIEAFRFAEAVAERSNARSAEPALSVLR